MDDMEPVVDNQFILKYAVCFDNLSRQNGPQLKWTPIVGPVIRIVRWIRLVDGVNQLE